MRGTLDCASARACASRALARRIEHDRLAAGKLGGHQRSAEQIARFRLDGLEARRRVGASERRDRPGVGVEGDDAGALGKP